jgi:hypothetical protein
MINDPFSEAVWAIAHAVLPEGWDVSPHAPDNYQDLALTVARTGRMVVSDSATDDPAFGNNQGTYHAFRAWHDWCHLYAGQNFSLRGECAAVRMQYAMLLAKVGKRLADQMRPILDRQIIAGNFGPDASCPQLLTGE